MILVKTLISFMVLVVVGHTTPVVYYNTDGISEPSVMIARGIGSPAHHGIQGSSDRKVIKARGIGPMLISGVETHGQWKNATNTFNTTFGFNISDSNSNTSASCSFSWVSSDINAVNASIKLVTWHACGTSEQYEMSGEVYGFGFMSFASGSSFSIRFLHLFRHLNSKGTMVSAQYISETIPINLKCNEATIHPSCKVPQLTPIHVDVAHIT